MDKQRGLTLPARGTAGDWILKLPDNRPGFTGVPEAEFGSLTLAAAVGIPVPDIQLLSAKGVPGLPDWVTASNSDSYAIQRFDRAADGRRVHAEVLAQVLDIPTSDERYKYSRANFDTIANVLAELCGRQTIGDVIDRIVLNALIGNGDAHLKNWAIIYKDGRNPSLSPLFDVLPTVLYIPGDDLGLKLNGSRAFSQVGTRSFDRLAVRAGLSVEEARNRAADAALRIASKWDILKDYLSKAHFATLTKHRDAIPVLRANR
ncbi:hypothetical protein Rhe02_61790 [Rhizocola hellebori]|uniref:HipA-like C-terminal domain-containing protein n=2 Tax=Rhizocola hellebori TaxID=1392758 RepID=A0A8J3VJ61_9ACTN|nr:hypothetical protein Rhe02_61790 [Rhizocola hellebori]